MNLKKIIAFLLLVLFAFLVSGLVEWSFDEVKANVEKYGFKFIEKYQTNEWCTAIFKKSK